MITKLFEIRDKATFIPIMATLTFTHNNEQRYLLERAGYLLGNEQVILTRIEGGIGKSSCYPYDWSNRTMQVAHEYISKKFNILNDGDVIDVEFILGETKEKKISERYGP